MRWIIALVLCLTFIQDVCYADCPCGQTCTCPVGGCPDKCLTGVSYAGVDQNTVRVIYNDGKRNYSWDVRSPVTEDYVRALVATVKSQSVNTVKTVAGGTVARPFCQGPACGITLTTTAPTVQTRSTSSVGPVQYAAPIPIHAGGVVRYGITSVNGACTNGQCQLQRK